jgi:GTP-binding protein
LFVDEAKIHVRGGKGGNGCVSFRREKYVPKGGPDGGNGGDGGSVYLVALDGIDTLLDLAGKHHWRAEDGRPGEGSDRHGRRGKPLDVVVPTGTLVYDDETGRRLKDLVHDGQRVCVARGGRGGYGNAHFVSSTNQAPREAQPGRPGQERMLRLELKLIADVGLVGLPNAGKSTLLSRLTNARPKIAAYPFTTREPQLGIAELPGYRRLVLADIPGLIAGAHHGAGLGDAFLRHIERTRVIVHLVDLCPLAGNPTPSEAYRIIRRELEEYSPVLAQRREIVAANKMDLTGADEAWRELQPALVNEAHPVSGVTGRGLRALTEAMWAAVEQVRAEERALRPELIDFGDAPAVERENGPDNFVDDGDPTGDDARNGA